MHSYTPTWPEDTSQWEPTSLDAIPFRDAHDLGAYAATDPLTTWYTYPHSWHLDENGIFCCCSKGSSMESVRLYAEQPYRLIDCRNVDTPEPCPDFWVVQEPRQRLYSKTYEPTEGDVAAFGVLRQEMAGYGITLLDYVIFTDDFRWWSMHELTTGTTAWQFVPAQGATRFRSA